MSTRCVAHGEDAEGNRKLEARTTVGTGGNGAYVMAATARKLCPAYMRVVSVTVSPRL